MKLVLRGSSLPLTLVGILAHVKITKVRSTLTPGTVGPCWIGMSKDELNGQSGWSAVAATDPGCMELYMGQDREKTPDLVAQLATDIVIQIQVYSRQFRTALGVGVGSTARDLSRLYLVMWQDADLAYVPMLGMGFQFDKGKVKSILVL